MIFTASKILHRKNVNIQTAAVQWFVLSSLLDHNILLDTTTSQVKLPLINKRQSRKCYIAERYK